MRTKGEDRNHSAPPESKPPLRFVELHARSAFSFLEGASLPEEYAGAAANFGLSAMALTDRDGFYGSPRFFLAMKKLGLRGHTGAEVSCTDGSRYPLLVKSRIGYQNLKRSGRTQRSGGLHKRQRGRLGIPALGALPARGAELP